ncbi:MAG: PilX N-terminal domain-containing pilus assembly protein, partial [Wenzhouxiangella sp.]
MKRPVHFSSQEGLALIFSLLILLVMTILAVGVMSSAKMQERMAGNARLQSLAFEAASAGVSSAIPFFLANRDDLDYVIDQDCGSSNHPGWFNASDDPIPTGWIEVDYAPADDDDFDERVILEQRMYCLNDIESDPDERLPRSQLFVESRGSIVIGGERVANRTIEARLDIGSDGGTGDGCGSLCFAGCEYDSLDFPTSNAFTVDGGGGPAITAGCEDLEQALNEAIRDNRIGNYDGGIAFSEPGEPWDDPDNVETFRENVEAAATAMQSSGCSNCYIGSNYSGSGNTTFGTSADPQITYIEGNADMGGNISGNGILLVNGDLEWAGTPNFDGLIVILGGSYSISGGGKGGNQAGSVVLLNAPGGSPAAEFDGISFGTSGGGTASFNFDCDSLLAAQALLDNQLGFYGGWTPECNTGPENPF